MIKVEVVLSLIASKRIINMAFIDTDLKEGLNQVKRMICNQVRSYYTGIVINSTRLAPIEHFLRLVIKIYLRINTFLTNLRQGYHQKLANIETLTFTHKEMYIFMLCRIGILITWTKTKEGILWMGNKLQLCQIK